MQGALDLNGATALTHSVAALDPATHPDASASADRGAFAAADCDALHHTSLRFA